MTFTATTALPYPHLERATAGLRGELRRQLVAAGATAALDRDAIEVTGPVETTDAAVPSECCEHHDDADVCDEPPSPVS